MLAAAAGNRELVIACLCGPTNDGALTRELISFLLVAGHVLVGDGVAAVAVGRVVWLAVGSRRGLQRGWRIPQSDIATPVVGETYSGTSSMLWMSEQNGAEWGSACRGAK